MSKALIIFIKNPELGKAKTRLAASVGDVRALEIYMQLLAHTRSISLEVDAHRLLYYSSFIDEQDAWSSDKFQMEVQRGNDLGEKMTNAFQDAFQSHNKVLIIGSDCMDLTPELIEQGFTELERHDFVLGPALDGGYYLLGMRSFNPDVFTDVAWSTENTLDQTLEKMIQPNHSVFLLPLQSDIDYIEDWMKYEQ